MDPTKNWCHRQGGREVEKEGGATAIVLVLGIIDIHLFRMFYAHHVSSFTRVEPVSKS